MKSKILFFLLGAMVATVSYSIGDLHEDIEKELKSILDKRLFENPVIFKKPVFMEGGLMVEGEIIITSDIGGNMENNSTIHLGVNRGGDKNSMITLDTGGNLKSGRSIVVFVGDTEGVQNRAAVVLKEGVNSKEILVD